MLLCGEMVTFKTAAGLRKPSAADGVRKSICLHSIVVLVQRSRIMLRCYLSHFENLNQK